MKAYEDEKIRFSYTDDFKLTRKKKKWGQYGIEKKLENKKTILWVIDIIEEEDVLVDMKRDIRNCFVDDTDEMKYLGDLVCGSKKGIGHVVTLNDFDHNFIQKRYRYLFPIDDFKGLYIEVIGEEDFEIDTYKEILESIEVKEEC